MIDGALGSEYALEKKHFSHPRWSEIPRFPFLKLNFESFRAAVETAPAADRQMGSELPLLARKAEGLQRRLYPCRQRSELPPFQPDPENSCPSYIRKYPHTSSKNSEPWEGLDRLLQRLGDQF